MSKPFGIAGVQMAVVPWDVDATYEKMAAMTRQISQSFPWVKMILFHELVVSALTQFDGPPSPEQWAKARSTVPGPLTDRLCELAKRHKLWLVPGSLFEVDGDKTYNTAVSINPEGQIVSRYRKIFPWYPFEAQATPGEEYCVFDVPEVGRFGLSICYDMWFPETIRTLAWMGADVILHPTMTPTQDRELELVLARANAITNQVYFIDVNGVGPWGGGQSLAVDPEGHVLHQAGEGETFFTVLIEPGKTKRVREFGSLGLIQAWKQLRDSGMRFPPYQEGFEDGAVFEGLGELKAPREVP